MTQIIEKQANQYDKGERVTCPHCGAVQPDEVEAYVVQGTLEAVTDSCEACHKRFSILELSCGLYQLRKLNTPPQKPKV